MTPLATIPILRMFDEQAARDFYVGFLGFQVDWEHRFEPDLPLYMQVSLGVCVLHLSGHHGDCCPGGAVRINVRGVEELQRSLLAKKYKFARPGLCATDWNSLEMSVTDPFGNRLTFAEYEGDGGASVGDAS